MPDLTPWALQALYARQEQVVNLSLRIDQVLALDPADYATSSRDFGRGFTLALALVRKALQEPQ